MGTNVVPADAGSDRGVYDSLEALRSLLIEGETHRSMCRSAPHLRAQASSHHGWRDDRPPHHRPAWNVRRLHSHRPALAGPSRRDAQRRRLRRDPARRRVSQQRPRDARKVRRATSSSTGLRKLEAQEVYRACQTRAQAWREKRRIRELEELRAKAGGIQIGAAAAEWRRRSVGGADEGDSSPMARLQRAKEMLQNGLLNDAEFEQIKAKILAEL